MPTTPIAAANLFVTPPAAAADGEVLETIIAGADWHLERIISLGHASPEGFWYDQEQDEWVLLARGSATLEIADQLALELQAGDYLIVPAGTRHRVARVSMDAVWLALHLH